MTTASKFYKSATIGDQYHKVVNQQLRTEANGDIAKILAAGLGIGAAARGATGLASMLKSNMGKKKIPTIGPVVTRIPMRLEEDDDDEIKTASWLMDELTGRNATTKGEIPYLLPAAGLGGAAALAAGWTGVDAVLDSARRKKENARLQQAKDEFHGALLDPTGEEEEKQSSASELGNALNSLYEAMEKSATAVVGPGLAAYGLYAGGSGLAAAYLAHAVTKKKQRHSLFQKAQKRRQIMRAQARPNEIYAIPYVAPKPKAEAPKSEPGPDVEDEVSEVPDTDKEDDT